MTMGNSSRKGARAERGLVNWLAENGWAVMRAPASGSATDRDLPDVLFGDGERFVAAEVKSSGEDIIYLDESEVDSLQYFADAFGAEAMAAVRFDLEYGDPAYGADRPGFYFIPLGKLEMTPGDNFRVRKDSAQTQGIREVDL